MQPTHVNSLRDPEQQIMADLSTMRYDRMMAENKRRGIEKLRAANRKQTPVVLVLVRRSRIVIGPNAQEIERRKAFLATHFPGVHGNDRIVFRSNFAAIVNGALDEAQRLLAQPNSDDVRARRRALLEQF
jgi:hypothetical protein